MRIKSIFGAALVIAATLAVPALAADSMKSSNAMMAGHGMMMKPGESMMMMPNGETMMVPAMKSAMTADEEAMMKTATPMDDCVIMFMGKDGKMMMMHDMKMADSKMACETMSKMGK